MTWPEKFFLLLRQPSSQLVSKHQLITALKL